jgi:hypothetical protein
MDEPLAISHRPRSGGHPVGVCGRNRRPHFDRRSTNDAVLPLHGKSTSQMLIAARSNLRGYPL